MVDKERLRLSWTDETHICINTYTYTHTNTHTRKWVGQCLQLLETSASCAFPCKGCASSLHSMHTTVYRG